MITLLDILKEQKASKYSGGIYHKTQIDLTYHIHFVVEKAFQSFLSQFFCKKVGIITFRRIGNFRFVLQEYFD